MAATWLLNTSDGSARSARQIAPISRIRSSGSARPTGTSKRTRVMWLPPSWSSSVRRLIGMVIRNVPTMAPWRSWYSRKPPAMAAMNASFRVPSTRRAAALNGSRGTSNRS